MEQSPRLSLSFVAPSQAQKHVTVNETFRRLDALTQMTVRSRTETAEPASPAEGDAYILASGAAGDVWSLYSAGDIVAYQDGAWALIAAQEGFRAWVADTDEFVVYDGAAWAEISGGGGGSAETAAKFGVNTIADTTNRLAVKSDAILFNHDDVTPGAGDIRVKVNKDAAGDTASVLFQAGASGRAEFGLTGDDDFHVKVSADGSAWKEAIVIDKDTGHVGVGTATPGYYSTPDRTLTIEGARCGFELVGSAAGSNAATASISFLNQQAVHADKRIGAIDVRTGTDKSAGNYAFYARNVAGTFTEALRVVEDGKIGIGSTSPGSKLHVAGGGVQVGAPTGGDKGAGAINAQAVYDDNTLLSCYVFDLALDGAVDAAKWNAKAPDRQRPAVYATREDPKTGELIDVLVSPAAVEPRLHEPMAKFAARAGTDYDPLTLDGYARHWKEKRHLTAMPNEAAFDVVNGQLTTGEWIQRLVETVEIQAVLIEALNARVKALESARAR